MINDETEIAYPNIVALVKAVGDNSPWYEKALYVLLIPTIEDVRSASWVQREQLERVEWILNRLAPKTPSESDYKSDYPYLHRLLPKDKDIQVSHLSDPFIIFGKGLLMTRAAANHIERLLEAEAELLANKTIKG